MNVNDPIVFKVKDKANEYIKSGIKPINALNKAVLELTEYTTYNEFSNAIYKK